MGWRTKRSEFESRQGQEFSLLHIIQTGSGVHPTSYPMGTRSFFPGSNVAGMWRWPLTSTSCPTSRKSGSIYTFTPPYVFMAWCLIKRRDIFLPLLSSYYKYTHSCEVRVLTIHFGPNIKQLMCFNIGSHCYEGHCWIALLYKFSSNSLHMWTWTRPNWLGAQTYLKIIYMCVFLTSCFYLKLVSETVICLLLQVEQTELGPNNTASTYVRTWKIKMNLTCICRRPQNTLETTEGLAGWTTYHLHEINKEFAHMFQSAQLGQHSYLDSHCHRRNKKTTTTSIVE
jgi:hypothetical protein